LSLATKWFLALHLALAALASGQQWPTFTVEQPYEWAVSTPEEQGLDSAIVDKALRKGRQLPYLNALLVVKNGFLVAERYYGDARATDANTVMSVSKSFLSAVAGIAVRRGYLSLGQRMMDFFPEYATPGLDSRKYDITIRHLLTMTSALPYDDHADHWNQWIPSDDWVGFCLGQPLDGNPGEIWHYSTCSTHIMSAVLTRATGMSTQQFAEQYLFGPLGITIGGWRQDPQGYYRGGWDMYFTPRDMARFGYLFLEKGRLDGRRIIAKKWVKKSTRAYVHGGKWGPMDEWGYGYWWWTGKGTEIYRMYFALGYGGQFIINIPKLDMVIVAAADANYAWGPAGAHVRAIRNLIGRYLLKPLKE